MSVRSDARDEAGPAPLLCIMQDAVPYSVDCPGPSQYVAEPRPSRLTGVRKGLGKDPAAVEIRVPPFVGRVSDQNR